MRVLFFRISRAIDRYVCLRVACVGLLGVQVSLFIGTEDPLVIDQSLAWGQRTGVQVQFTTLCDRAALSARLPRDQSEFITGKGVHHDLEYLRYEGGAGGGITCSVCPHACARVSPVLSRRVTPLSLPLSPYTHLVCLDDSSSQHASQFRTRRSM